MHLFFFFNDTATTEIYTLSLHDALPIYLMASVDKLGHLFDLPTEDPAGLLALPAGGAAALRCRGVRSEEHTSELQSRQYFVCRLLLVKKKNYIFHIRKPQHDQPPDPPCT